MVAQPNGSNGGGEAKQRHECGRHTTERGVDWVSRTAEKAVYIGPIITRTAWQTTSFAILTLMHFSDLSQYDYELPSELIRTVPLEPRDSARLFVYDTKTDEVTFDIFRNLAAHLPAEALLVLNETRVRPARLWLRKPTGGKIEVFILVNEWSGIGLIPALVDRHVNLGDRLVFPDGAGLIVERQEGAKFFFRLESAHSLDALLDTFGETPIPHYLKSETGPDEADLRMRYQAVFAAAGQSVAAPTASLHFTDEMLRLLHERNVETARLTLDVGLGTFSPLCEEHFSLGRLHAEKVSLPEATAEQVRRAKNAGRQIVSVGTTTTRALESLSRDGRLRSHVGTTDIFIVPPYHFQTVDALITNFHLPKSSLMLLVDAFLRHKGAKKSVIDLYGIAVAERFAFYSFGDSLFIR